MNMKNIAAAIALVASANIVGCAQLDTGALAKTGATAGAAAASAGKGGNKTGAAVAAGAVGVGAASAIAASRTEAKPTDTPAQSSASTRGGTQPTATQTTATTQSRPAATTTQPQSQPTPKPANKPQYTVAQYRAAFAKKTPEQIVAYLESIRKLDYEKRMQQGFDFDTARSAVPLNQGFEVAALLGAGVDQVRVLEATYEQLKKVDRQEDLKTVISKLSALEKCCQVRYREEEEYSRFHEVIVDKISDPSVADFMLSTDCAIGRDSLRALVSKLSEAKKNELYDAAMKRAAARKDRLVMEGYYLNMPVLDLAILNWRNGFDKQTKIGGKTLFPLWYWYSSIDNLSKQTVTGITFYNKAWMKFMDCADKDALRQLIHQYVDKKTGKANELDYYDSIKVETVDITKNVSEVGHVYSNSRLETKVAYITEKGWIVFMEF